MNAEADNDVVKTLRRIIQGEGVQTSQKFLKKIHKVFNNDSHWK